MNQKTSAREWFMKGCRDDLIGPQSYEAIEAYKRSIVLDPTFTASYVNLGFIYLQREDYEWALICLQRVTELEPSNPEAYNNLGYVYEKMGRLGSAKQIYERALALDKGNTEAVINLGYRHDALVNEPSFDCFPHGFWCSWRFFFRGEVGFNNPSQQLAKIIYLR